jgi:hypothetical protein
MLVADVAPRRVDFFIYVRASCVCFSHMSRDVSNGDERSPRHNGVVFRDGPCLLMGL